MLTLLLFFFFSLFLPSDMIFKVDLEFLGLLTFFFFNLLPSLLSTLLL